MTLRSRIERLEQAAESLPEPPPPLTLEEAQERFHELWAGVQGSCQREGLAFPAFGTLSDAELSELAGPRDQEVRVCGTTPAAFGIAVLARIVCEARRLQAADAKRRRRKH